MMRLSAARWTALWDGEEAPLVQALLRIVVGSMVALDLLDAARRGLVPILWAPRVAGGLREVMDPLPDVWKLLPASVDTAWMLWGTATLSACLFAVGFLTRPAALVLLLAYGQLALVLPNGDRGIDTILRNVIAILLFSGAGRGWSLDCLLRTGRVASDETVPRWPRRLVVLQVAVLYFLSASQKIAHPWTPMGGFTALWYVVHDVQITRFVAPPSVLLFRITQLGTAVTLLFEASFPLLLVLHRRWGRPGFNDPRTWWLSVGIVFHLLLAATLRLGIFPWAMMGLYVAFFTPAEVRGWGQALRRSWRITARSSVESGTT